MGDSENKAKKYELSAIDIRFLKAVDVVIAKNKNADVKLGTDSSVSSTVFGSRNVIGKIRSSQRGVTTAQIDKFAIYFNLDFNCFFRDIPKIKYDPNSIGNKVVAKDNAQVNYGENGRNINTSGGEYFENNYHGEIKEQVQQAKKIINKTECPPEVQKKCHTVLDKIQHKSINLETLLDNKTESLKKIADLLTLETSNREKAEKELQVERVEHQKLMKKHISLLEKIN